MSPNRCLIRFARSIQFMGKVTGSCQQGAVAVGIFPGLNQVVQQQRLSGPTASMQQEAIPILFSMTEELGEQDVHEPILRAPQEATVGSRRARLWQRELTNVRDQFEAPWNLDGKVCVQWKPNHKRSVAGGQIQQILDTETALKSSFRLSD